MAIEFNAKIRNTVFGRYYCSECHVGFFVKDMYDNHMQSPDHMAKEFLNRISSATSTVENEYSIELNSVKNAILNIDKDKPGKGGKKRKFPKGMRNNQPKPKLGNANLVPIGQPPQSKKKKMPWNSQGKNTEKKVNIFSQNQSTSPQNNPLPQLQNNLQTQHHNSQPKTSKKPKRNRNRTKKPNIHVNPQFYQRQIFPTSYYPQYEYVPYIDGPAYHPGQGYGYFSNFPPGNWGHW